MSHTDEWGPLAEPVHSNVTDLTLPWRDNAWLLVLAPEIGVYGTVHVSTSPNAGARRAQCNFAVKAQNLRIVEPLDPGTFRSASIDYRMDGVVEVDHPLLRMLLKLKPRFQYGDYTVSNVFVPLDERKPLNHFQQGVDIVGHIDTDGLREEFSGVGFRDRTWGYRDEVSHVTEYAALIGCFDDFDVTIMKFGSPTGHRTQGFVLGVDGLEVTGMAVTRNSYGFFKSAELVAGERTVAVSAEPVGADCWLATGETTCGPSLQVHDEFLKLTTSDGAEGYGVVEQGILHTVF